MAKVKYLESSAELLHDIAINHPKVMDAMMLLNPEMLQSFTHAFAYYYEAGINFGRFAYERH